MDTRASTRARISVLPVLIALFFNVALVAPVAPLIATPALALGASTFNASDGNLTDDGAAETDWCTPAPNLLNIPDEAPGNDDNAFKGNATTENHDVPSLDVNAGAVPPANDLLRQYIASETIGGDLYVYLAWVRGSAQGTSTVDFEFNQSDVVTSNGVTKDRTDGDLLLSFDFQANPTSGGYDITLILRTWNQATAIDDDNTSTPQDTGEWINPQNLLTLALGEGSVNDFNAAIPDCVAGGTIEDGRFGEAVFNLTDVIGGQCRAFGSVLTKTRSSSSSFGNSIQDYITPAGVDFSTCGQLTINKVDANQQPLGGATFSISPNPFGGDPDPLSVTDNVAPDDNAADGVIHLSDVEPGTYHVCETDPPDGYIGAEACQDLLLAANGAISFTFVNTLGAIDWVKVDEQSGAKICCATFLLEGTAGAATGFSVSVTDNDGVTDADADIGEIKVTGLKLGTYTITETVPPTNYDLPALADRTQTVVLDDESASAGFAFQDPPQADASTVKDAVLSPIIAGTIASFDITVTAGGTGTSEDVVLTDLNETDHTWSITGDDAAACGTLPLEIDPGEELICDFGDIENTDFRTIRISMPTNLDDCEAAIENKASIESSNDHDAGNNSDDASITVLCPNPGVVKEGNAEPIVFGEDAVFTITVHAGGTGPAENVELTDLNETGHEWTVGGTHADACTADTVADGETLTCNWDLIPAGDSRVVTITMTSGEQDCEIDIANTAIITASADVDESNNSSTDTVSVLCPDPSVLKTADDPSITADDEASFDIVVHAGGEGNSTGVILEDVNETDHIWAITGADAGSCGTLPLTIDPGETLTCNFGEIPNRQDREITITMTSSEDDCALGIENTASITADADVDESNNEWSASIEVLCPDLELVKDGSDPVSAGDDVFFTLTVTNEGDGTAKNVVLTDRLPGEGLGTWFVDATENIDANDCGIVADVLTCMLAELAPDAWFSVTVMTTTGSDACPDVENDADVAADNEDPNGQFPDEDSYTITVNCPDVTIDKEPIETPVSGGDVEPAQFSIKVWNLGPGTAYDVEVSDTAPLGTVWTVLDADGFACDDEIVEGQQTVTCTLDELAAGVENARTILIGYTTTQEDCGVLDNAVTVFADNEPAEDTENNSDDASIVVECPGLNIVKTADADPIDAGDEASFTITVWNALEPGGTAFGVTLEDDLPAGLEWDFEVLQGEADCDLASSLVNGAVVQMSIDCDLGDLAPSAMEEGVIIRVFAETDRDDCGQLTNTAFADASNDDEVSSTATITVRCPTIALEKENDAVGSVLPGTTVTYTLTLTVDDGPADDVMVVDTLPVGLENPTNISDGGEPSADGSSITWDLGDLADGEYTLTYEATVADDVENGEELVNAAAATSTNSQCPDLETLGPECEDDSTVIVRVPTLVIDKVADVEVITISGPNDDLVADPSVVTWTLTYTLTDGPVTNAVITDEVPEGFEFLDASIGGTLTDGVVTWTFDELSASGSVTFRTTVDPETISRVAPTVNVAVIDSDETEPDEGEDSVTVVVEPPPLGGTPTPRPSLPNTASGFGMNGEPVTIPVELLVAFFIGSLGVLTLANVKARSRRS